MSKIHCCKGLIFSEITKWIQKRNYLLNVKFWIQPSITCQNIFKQEVSKRCLGDLVIGVVNIYMNNTYYINML
jgi:hypothetical protein